MKSTHSFVVEPMLLTEMPQNQAPKTSGHPINVYSINNSKWSRKIRKSKDPITVKTKVSKRSSEGYNVIGVFDVGATHSVLIGAHYDHLGKGEFLENKKGKEEWRGKGKIQS